MENTYISFIDEFRIIVDGKKVCKKPFQKVLSLLLILVLESDYKHSRKKMATCLWPALPGDKQRNNLRQAINRIRKILNLTNVSSISLDAGKDYLLLKSNGGLLIDVWMVELTAEENPQYPAIVSAYFKHRFNDYQINDCEDFNQWLRTASIAFEHKLLAGLTQWLILNKGSGVFDDVELAYNIFLKFDENKLGRYLDLVRYCLDSGKITKARKYCKRAEKISTEFTQKLTYREKQELLSDLLDGTACMEKWKRPISILWVSYQHDDIDDKELFTVIDSVERWFLQRNFTVLRQINGEMLIESGADRLLEQVAGNMLSAWFSCSKDVAGCDCLRALLFSDYVNSAGLSDSYVLTKIACSASKQIRGVSASSGLWMTELSRGRLERAAAFSIDYQKQGDLYKVCNIVRHSPVESWEHADARTVFLGRSKEIARMDKIWSSVLLGNSSSLLIQGEAGIGKSRLLAEFCRSLKNKADINILKCQQSFNAEPFSIFIEWIKREVLPEPCENVFDCISDTYNLSKEKAAFIAYLLGSDNEQVVSLSIKRPEYIRQGIAEQLLCMLNVSAGKHRLLVIEDLHWIDSASLEVIERLCVSVPDRFFVVMTSRPDFDGDNLKTNKLILPALNNAVISDLVFSILSKENMRTELLNKIVVSSSGVPLYAEELAIMLKGNDCIDEVPDSLIELLNYRLNQMGELLGVALTAAVIGRNFSLSMVAVLLGREEKDVSEDLDAICKQGLFEKRPNKLYQFKHHLIYKAACGLIDGSVKKQTHHDIAVILESGDHIAPVCRMLAEHWQQAGYPDKALKYRMLHARQLVSFCSYREAYEYNEITINYLSSNAEVYVAEFIDSLHMQSNLSMMLNGYGCDEIFKLSNKEISLCQAHGNLPAEFFARLTLWYTSSTRSGHTGSREEALKLLAIADELGNNNMKVQAHYCFGNAATFLGDLVEAENSFQWVVEHADETYDQHADSFGEHAVVLSYSFLAWIKALKYNDLTAALNLFDVAIELGQRIENEYSVGFAYVFRLMLLGRLDRYELIAVYLPSQKLHVEVNNFVFLQVCGATIEDLHQIKTGVSRATDSISRHCRLIKEMVGGHQVTFGIFFVKSLYVLQQWEELQCLTNTMIEVSLTKSDFFHLSDLYYYQSQIPDFTGGVGAMDKSKYWAKKIGITHVLDRNYCDNQNVNRCL